MLRRLNASLLYPIAERCLGRDIGAKAAALRYELRMPFAERRRRNRARLAAVLTSAGRDVPYYRDLFKRLRFQPWSVTQSLDAFCELPYLTKEIIREQGFRLRSTRLKASETHVRKTGGSTGPGAAIYYSSAALDWTAAVNIVAQEWAGRPRSAKELHLASRFPETFPWKDRFKDGLKSRLLNRVNLFTADFEPDSLERIWRSIRAERPYLVQGHPSTLYALAMHLRNCGHSGAGAFDVFESTGEALDDKKRVAIETVFACRTINRFGNAEFGVVAYEPLGEQARRLRVFDGVVWPEALPHESAGDELVLTGLLNQAMPLIRYRTGDLAELTETDEGYFLKQISGRIHDLVRIGDRCYPTHYVQDLLDRIGGIDEFQIEERPGRSLLLRIVMQDVHRRDQAAQRIQKWWSGAVEVEFTEFSGLARSGWRGKFRYVIQRAAA